MSKKTEIPEKGMIDDMLEALGGASLSDSQEDALCETSVPFSQRAKSFFKNENGERAAAVKKAKNALRSSRAKHGAVSVVLTAVFLVAVILFNVIAVLISDRFPLMNIDLTSDSAYSLSDTTVDILKGLKDDIAIIILASENNCTKPDATVDPYNQIPQAHELILRYAGYSDHISIDHVDLTRTPGILQEEFLAEYAGELGDYSIIVLNQNNNRVRVTSFYDMLPSLSSDYYYDATEAGYDINSSYAESELTSAIRTVAVERDTLPVAAYVSDLEGNSECAYFLSSLSQNGYTLSELHTHDEIPNEAEILVLPAPAKDIPAWFAANIELWLYNDGKYGHTLFVFTNAAASELPELDNLLAGWGLKCSSDMVFEGSSDYVIAGSSLNSCFYAQYPESSTYTNELRDRGKMTAVMMPNNIELLFASQDNKVTNAILTSSENGFACESADYFDMIKNNAESAGQKAVMASSTWYGTDEEGNQLRSDIIIAPATICQSEYFNSASYGNFPLLMGICNERTGMGTTVIDIQAKYLTDIDFSIDDASLSSVRIVFRIIVPLLLLIAGIVVYVRRRFL